MGNDPARGDVSPYEVELIRLRYFLDMSGVSREGVDNIIRCYTEAVEEQTRRQMVNDRNMIGFCQEYYTLQNADGHDLVLNVDNWFLTEDIAAEKAEEVCVDYHGVVMVRKHVDTVARIFTAVTTAQEVTDTTGVAS